MIKSREVIVVDERVLDLGLSHFDLIAYLWMVRGCGRNAEEVDLVQSMGVSESEIDAVVERLIAVGLLLRNGDRLTLIDLPEDEAEKHLPSAIFKSSAREEKVVSGFVYLIHAVGSSRYKIGVAKDVSKRLRQLKRQSPYSLSLIHSFWAKDAYGVEAELHYMLRNKQVHNEWFELSAKDVELICSTGESNEAL